MCLEILKLFAILLIPAAFGLLLSIVGINDWFAFIRGIACYVAIYIGFLFMFGLKKDEKNKILNKVFKKQYD